MFRHKGGRSGTACTAVFHYVDYEDYGRVGTHSKPFRPVFAVNKEEFHAQRCCREALLLLFKINRWAVNRADKSRCMEHDNVHILCLAYTKSNTWDTQSLTYCRTHSSASQCHLHVSALRFLSLF
ncbi:hypothetical protein J6590_066004 [Homalodisca vitripennis]|nr:hypothetical protein J6590_066004 [Homalodisca vitripennis]